MLARLADAARRDGDCASAIEYASLVLQYDAGREDAHRILMACYAQLGQRVQAMRQYQLCERILREAFDAIPDPATRALYDQMRLRPGNSPIRTHHARSLNIHLARHADPSAREATLLGQSVLEQASAASRATLAVRGTHMGPTWVLSPGMSNQGSEIAEHTQDVLCRALTCLAPTR